MKEILRAIQDIPREKLPKALLMAFFFFLVISMFWVLKPMKVAIFMDFYSEEGFNLFGWQMAASQAEQLAKTLNMVMAAIGVILFTWLSHRFTRQKLVYICSSFFIVCFVGYSLVISNPSAPLAWTFYLFGDFFNTVMVVLFWAFLNDIVLKEEAKKLYGLCGLGGVLGGFFGSFVIRAFVKEAIRPPLLLACIGGAALVMLTAFLVGRIARREEEQIHVIEEPQPEIKMPKKGRAAIEGAKLVFSSKYLLAIVAIIGCYEIVSSIMDFQWKTTVNNLVAPENLSVYYPTIFLITNSVAVFVQLFLTSMVMRKLGVGIGLLFLPIAVFCSSTAFLIFPILLLGNFLTWSDNSLNYSINQSSKEALYVPTTPEVKYRAKAFIDMFVMRFSKTIAVVINLAVSAAVGIRDIRWLSIASITMLIIWFFAVRYAGRQFEIIKERRILRGEVSKES